MGDGSPLELTPLRAGQLIDQVSGFPAYEVKRLEHRIALVQPFPGVRLCGAEQTADFGGDFFQTRS